MSPQQGHGVRICKVDYKKIMNRRGCWFCLDLDTQYQYKPHSPYECQIKQRLRCLIIDAFQEQNVQNDMSNFATHIFANTTKFYEFLAQYDIYCCYFFCFVVTTYVDLTMGK